MASAVSRTILALLFLCAFQPAVHAAEAQSQGEEEPVIDVMGKIQDHYYVTVVGADIPLPRILFMEGSLVPKIYLSTSSAVDSGEFRELPGYTLESTTGDNIVLDMSLTSHLVYFWIAIFLTLWLTLSMAKRYKKGVGRETEPKGWFQNLFELTFVFIRDDIAKDNIPESKYQKFVPYLFAVFIAITFMNLFGLLPWGVTATADITVTGILAAFTFIITQWNGSKDHWEHVFWFPGVPGLMRIILTPIEILGLFTKPLALAIRLFANMLSGKIMIVCILGLIFIFAEFFGTIVGASSSIVVVPLTVALYVLKAFVGVLQAYIFTLLSAVFIGMAAEEHEHLEGVEAHA
ncbi:MAG: F0F1 ATP synthase subunit A [Bacteroidetes bacterium]|jgi:F-type H+-transporting ATPase subunit a|nr:F0F1 ATP synthase subunit A [Bacteroidota bacterium]